MDLFKLDKYDKYFIAFILVVITLFNIGQCFASEVEDCELIIVNNLYCNPNSNHFIANDSNKIGYVRMEKGYIYTITSTSPNPRYIVVSSELPSVNVTYDYVGQVNSESNIYSYYCSNDQYLYISTSNNYGVNVTRQKVEGMEGSISGLVENVGVNQLWNVFEGGVDFIGVVVLVAFGLFLVFLLIKKLSKGKADF